MRYLPVTTLLILALTACSDTDPIEPPTDETALTVDASTTWAFVDLGETATQIAVGDASTSEDWDVAFNATRIMLNGGAAGPADVEGYCVCQNASASDAQVQAMTAGDELVDFEAVTLSDVPADENAWESDALDLAIDGWYTYNMATHQVSADPSKTWLVRGAGADPEYAKLRVTQIADATQAGARVTIEFAVQPDSGVAMGAVQSVVLDGRTSPVHFDLGSGTVSSASNWDVVLDGFDIRINGGASGSGGAGAVRTSDGFGAVADASSVPARVYRGDAFGGAFTTNPWYRYNLDGNHTVFPTYDVYLIRRGADVYKLQVIGYYNTTGDARWITFRSARLE